MLKKLLPQLGFEPVPLKLSTVSAQLERHSWIEPHPLQKLIQPQSKTDIETIKPQLEFNPSQKSISDSNKYAIWIINSTSIYTS